MKKFQFQFVGVPKDFIRSPEFTPMEKAIYAIIRSHGTEGDPDSAFPSRRTIAGMVPCSISSVARAIKKLRACGRMTYISGTKNKSNTYNFADLEMRGRVMGDTTLDSPMTPARITHDSSMMPLTTHYPESYTKNYKPEKCPILFHGRDEAFIQKENEVMIKLASGGRVPWSGYEVEAFRYEDLRGEDALRAARRRYTPQPGLTNHRSGTMTSLPTSEENSDSSRPTSPLLNNSTND